MSKFKYIILKAVMEGLGSKMNYYKFFVFLNPILNHFLSDVKQKNYSTHNGKDRIIMRNNNNVKNYKQICTTWTFTTTQQEELLSKSTPKILNVCALKIIRLLDKADDFYSFGFHLLSHHLYI